MDGQLSTDAVNGNFVKETLCSNAAWGCGKVNKTK